MGSPAGTYNVLDFGAIGDGTDAKAPTNRAAIQSAIDAAQKAGGGNVLLPSGIYCIDDTLSITGDAIRFAGDSYGTTLKINNAGRDLLHVGGDGFALPDGVRNCVVEHVDLQSSVAMLPETYAIRVRNGHGIVLQNLAVNGYGGLRNGLLLQGGDGMYTYHIMNCEINEMEENGIVINKGTADATIKPPQNVRITNTEIGGGDRTVRCIWAQHVSGLYISQSEVLGGKAGLVLEPGENGAVRFVLVSNFLSDSCEDDQFYAAPGINTNGIVTDIQVSNSWFASSREGHGINVRGVAGLQVNGCKIVNNAHSGIQLFSDNKDVIINGSIIAANNQANKDEYHGIYVGPSNRETMITSNEIGMASVARNFGFNYQRYGIFLDNTDDFIVSNNILRGNTRGGLSNYQGAGPSRVVANNIA